MAKKHAAEMVERSMAFAPYFDQEPPQVPVIGLIADQSSSIAYELDAMAVFKSRPGYLVVHISGCSCWPCAGTTTQWHCHTIGGVVQVIRSNPEFSALIHRLHEKGW